MVLRPPPTWTFVVYAGKEQADSRFFSLTSGTKTYGYGYGSSTFDNSGCEIEGSSACAANTSSITPGTIGGWWKFYQGTLGNMQVGLTYTYKEIFAGIGGAPNTNINILLASFRFYPFQK